MSVKTNTKTGLFYLIANFFNKGLSFLLIPIFTRLLSIEDYGIINVYNAWVGIFTIFVGIALHMSVRSSFVDYEDDVDGFLSSIFLLTIVSTFTASLFVYFIILIFRIKVDLLLLFFCIVQSLSSAIILDYSTYLMMKLKYKLRALLLVFPNLFVTIITLFLLIFYFEEDKYLAKIVPTALILFMIAVIIVLKNYKQNNFDYYRLYWIYALKISLPIVLHGLSLNILGQSDRIMLTNYIGVASAGVYSLVYNFSMIASVFIVSLEGVWVPWFTSKLKSHSIKEINERVKIFIDIITLVVLLIIFTSPEIIKLLAPPKYWDGIFVAPPIVIASFVVFLYTLYVNVEHFYKKTLVISVNTLVAAIINIILNSIFIPHYGIVAAAYSTLISYLCLLLFHYFYTRKLERDIFPFRQIYKYILFVTIGVFSFHLTINLVIIRWILAGLIFVYYVYLNKNNIRKLI